MILFDESKKNIWRTIKRDATRGGRLYDVKYCLRTDGSLGIRCSRNSAELDIKLEDLYSLINYIELLLKRGYVNEVRRDEKNIATNGTYNPTIFIETFGDVTKYFHGNNWWEKDLNTVMEFLITNSGKEVIKKYTGDRLKSELSKLNINCLDSILKEVVDGKDL